MNSHRIVLHFNNDATNQPVIYTLCQKYNLVCSIIKASIEPNQEGYVALEISGEDKNYDQAMEYLKEMKIRAEDFRKRIIRNEDKCTDCGACVGFCPTGALSMNAETRKISFDDSKCVACSLCTRACPFKAMQTNF